jgi:hypothetical protein
MLGLRMLCLGHDLIVPNRIAPSSVPAYHRTNDYTLFLQGRHKLANRLSAMGIPLSSNQVSFSHCNSVVPQEHHGICTSKCAFHVVNVLLTFLISAGISRY